MTLYTSKVPTTKKSAIIVNCEGYVLIVSKSSMLPSRLTLYLEKPYNGVNDGLNLSSGRPIWSYIAQLRMFTELPLLTNKQYTL